MVCGSDHGPQGLSDTRMETTPVGVARLVPADPVRAVGLEVVA